MYYDLIIIGAGSGGIRAARLAAQAKQNVLLIEKDEVGGTCVNKGCIPKKILFYAAKANYNLDYAKAYSWQINNQKLDWPTLIANKDKEITRLQHLYHKTIKDNNITLVHGFGQIIDQNTVKVNNIHYTGNHILLAVGCKSNVPNIPGIEHANNSDQIFHMPSLPKNMVIIGGGYIAIEFASIFSKMGVNITLLVRSDRILKQFDHELVDYYTKILANDVKIIFNCQPQSITKQQNSYSIITADQQTINTDYILYATGREPNINDISDSALQLQINNTVKKNPDFCTNIKSISAIGDMVNKNQLTPIALYEADCFVSGKYLKKHKFNKITVPSAAFTLPCLANAGLTEEQAKKQHDINVYVKKFTPLANCFSTHPYKKSMIKMITKRKTDEILGLSMLDIDSPEIIQSLAISIGMLKNRFANTIGLHPTISEEFFSMNSVTREVDKVK